MKILGLLLLLTSSSYAYESDLCVAKHSNPSKVLIRDISFDGSDSELSIKGSSFVLKSTITTDPKVQLMMGGGGGGGTSGGINIMDFNPDFEPSSSIAAKFSKYLKDTGVRTNPAIDKSNLPDLLNVVSQLNDCEE